MFCAETQVVEPLLEVIEQFCATSCSTLTAQMLYEALGVLLTQTGVWFRLCCQDDRSPCALCVNAGGAVVKSYHVLYFLDILLLL